MRRGYACTRPTGLPKGIETSVVIDYCCHVYRDGNVKAMDETLKITWYVEGRYTVENIVLFNTVICVLINTFPFVRVHKRLFLLFLCTHM